MQSIPRDILAEFDGILKQRNVPLFSRADYRKWLLYFLDFRAKNPLPDAKSDQVRLFAEKLRSKNQTAMQVGQAANAISMFFTSQQGTRPISSAATERSAPRVAGTLSAPRVQAGVLCALAPKKDPGMICEPPASSMLYAPRERGGKQYDEWRCLRKSESPAWDKIIENLADEIKLRHYSRKTLKHYADWSRKFQSYLKDKTPEDLSSKDVKKYRCALGISFIFSLSVKCSLNLSINPSSPSNIYP